MMWEPCKIGNKFLAGIAFFGLSQCFWTVENPAEREFTGLQTETTKQLESEIRRVADQELEKMQHRHREA